MVLRTAEKALVELCGSKRASGFSVRLKIFRTRVSLPGTAGREIETGEGGTHFHGQPDVASNLEVDDRARFVIGSHRDILDDVLAPEVQGVYLNRDDTGLARGNLAAPSDEGAAGGGYADGGATTCGFDAAEYEVSSPVLVSRKVCSTGSPTRILPKS